MKNYIKLTGPNSKNPTYGRKIYNQAIYKEFRHCMNTLDTLSRENSSGKKFFTAKLVKDRFKGFCKEIMEDFRTKYKSSEDNNRLNDEVMEKSTILDNLIAVKML